MMWIFILIFRYKKVFVSTFKYFKSYNNVLVLNFEKEIYIYIYGKINKAKIWERSPKVKWQKLEYSWTTDLLQCAKCDKHLISINTTEEEYL